MKGVIIKMSDSSKLERLFKELKGTANMALQFGLPLDWIIKNILGQRNK